MFLAEVIRAEASSGLPLTYFRGRFGRLEPVEDEAVYDDLRQRVLRGEFGEGEKIPVSTLASRLQAETWHVYHALTRLVSDGIVVCDPVSGYVIAPIDLRAVEDSLEGRRAIEIGVAELSVGRVTSGEIAELRRRMERTLPLIVDGRFVDVHRYATANAAFHEYLVGLAKSDALLLAYRRLGLPGILARSLRSSNVAFEGLLADHRELVQTFEAGDVVRAKEVIDRHTDHAKLTHRRAFELKREQTKVHIESKR